MFIEEQEEKRYRAYLTDVLMLVSKNTARFVEGGEYLTDRWVEGSKPVDTRTGDEIAADVIKRAGLTLKGGEEQWTYSPL